MLTSYDCILTFGRETYHELADIRVSSAAWVCRVRMFRVQLQES